MIPMTPELQKKLDEKKKAFAAERGTNKQRRMREHRIISCRLCHIPVGSRKKISKEEYVHDGPCPKIKKA